MYECPSCGGNLRFDIASQQMKCIFCDSQYDPYAVKDKSTEVSEGYYEINSFICPQCGGEMLGDDTDVTAFCSFCGAANVLSSRLVKEKRPDKIIPFKVTKEQCKKAYLEKAKKTWFVAKEYKDAKYVDGFRGIYMPYWQYDQCAKGKLTLKGTTTHTKGNYEYTEHYDLKGKIDAECDGLAYDASSSFSDNISQMLAPYDIKEETAFTPAFMSGFYADTADLSEEIYQETAKKVASAGIYAKLKQEPSFKKYTMKDTNNTQTMQNKLTVSKSYRNMYPVWFMSYRNKDRVAYSTINGQNGRVVANLPKNPTAYLLASLALAVPIFLLLSFLPVMLPSVFLTIVTACGMLGIWLLCWQLKTISIRDKQEDDLGALAKRQEQEFLRRQKEMELENQLDADLGITYDTAEFDASTKATDAEEEDATENGGAESTDEDATDETGPEPTDEDATEEAEEDSQKVKSNVKKSKTKIEVKEVSIGGTILGMLVTLVAGIVGAWIAPVVVIIIAAIADIVFLSHIYKYKTELKLSGGSFGWFVLLASLVGLVLVATASIHDILFYGCAIVILVLTVLNILECITHYNMLVTKPLPQFEKKGGDDDA